MCTSFDFLGHTEAKITDFFFPLLLTIWHTVKYSTAVKILKCGTESHVGKYLWLDMKNMYMLSLYSAKSFGSFRLLIVAYNGHKSSMKSGLEQKS